MAEIIVRRVVDLNDESDFKSIASIHGGVFFKNDLINGAGADVEQLAILEGDRICGGFMVQYMKLKGISTISNPKFHPHCSLFVLPGGNAENLKPYLDAISLWLSSQRAKIIAISFPPNILDVQPFIWRGFKSSIKYTYRFSLADADILATISGKRRNLINSAMKEGVEVSRCGQEELVEGLKFSGQLKGFNVDDRAIEKISASGAAYKATANGNVIASALFADDSNTRYYLFGGADRNAHSGALSAIIYQAMCDAQKSDLSVFDFEGSMIPGVEMFFRSFGGSLTPYISIARSPWWLTPFLRWKGRTEF